MKQHFQLSKVAAALAVAGGVSLFGSSAMAAASTPLAGQNISNVATATYTDNTLTERVVTSNVVKTLVAQVGSFTLVQSNERQTAANSSVSFPHILTNTGNGTDSFKLSIVNDASGSFDWASYNVYIDRNQDGIADDGAAALTPTTAIELAAGESIGLVVVAKTPLAATAGQNDSLILTATATTTALYDAGKNTASNTDKATIITGAVIEIKKEASVSTIGANGYITYTLTFQNKGTAAATSDVIIYDVLPGNVTFADTADGKLTAHYNGSTSALTRDGTDSDKFAYVSTGRTDSKEAFTFNAGKLAAGSTGKLTFTVKVKTAAANGEKITNTAYADIDGFTPDTTTPLTPDNVPSAPPVTTDTTLIPSNPNNVTVVGTTAHSINDDKDASWTDGKYTGSVLDIDDKVHAAASQGQAIVFGNNAAGGDVIYVHNSGTTTDSYNLSIAELIKDSLPPGSIIEILKADGKTPVTDNNTGPIEAGGSLKFVVRVTLPTSGTVADGTTLTMTSTSVSNSNNKDTISLVVDSFTKSAVDLVHNKGTTNLPDYVGSGLNSSTGVPDTALVPGTSQQLDVTIKNTGGTPDNYNIAVEGVPTGWTAELFGKDGYGNCTNTKVTNSGTIANSGAGSYCLVVTAPDGTPATDIAKTITVKISSPSTGTNDSIGFDLTVAEQRAISFTPDRQGQLAPGGSIIYSHTLTNIGNVAEAAGGKTLNFALPTPAAGETVTVYVDVNGDGLLDDVKERVTGTGAGTLNSILQNAKLDKAALAGLQQGESVTVYVKVEAAATATAGQSYTSTVQIQPEAGATLGSNSILSITDRTVINLGSVRLEKFQFAADCTATPADADYTVNLQNAKPGQCVFYKVTATNQGNADATAVAINDAVPAYTKYKGGSVAREPAAQGTAPTEANGNVNYNVGTLTPGASATLKFAVTVDKAAP